MPPQPRSHSAQPKPYDLPLEVSSGTGAVSDAKVEFSSSSSGSTQHQQLPRSASAPVNSVQQASGVGDSANSTSYGAGRYSSTYGAAGSTGYGTGAYGGMSSSYGGGGMYGGGMYGGGGYGSSYGGYGSSMYGGGYGSRMGMYGGGYGMGGMGMEGGMGPQFSWLHSIQHFTSSMGYLTEVSVRCSLYTVWKICAQCVLYVSRWL